MIPFRLISKCPALSFEAAELQAELATEQLQREKAHSESLRAQVQALETSATEQFFNWKLRETALHFIILALGLFILYQYVREQYR